MRFLFASLLLLTLLPLGAQPDFYKAYPASLADSLRGSLRPERTCFDVTFYGLHLAVDMDKEALSGYVDIDFTMQAASRYIQLDLDPKMTIERILLDGQTVSFYRGEAPSDGGSGEQEIPGNRAFFIDFGRELPSSSQHRATVYYAGSPQKAANPPWDGGFVWASDAKDRSWVGVACEGDGASLWWPNKDHLSDEPDSVLISVTVPKRFFVAANGNLRKETELKESQRKQYDWFVANPINNYNISINIGHYAHFSDVYKAADGEELSLDYYVLDYNQSRAEQHFKQVKPMLEAYEHYFGKYPFWEDGYALIETPYLGMEHQSGIAYGNRYMRGYMGGMIPKGMNWDYIIIHETGHEYFGNSISVADHAEMWIHESFTTYMEALYVEYIYNKERAVEYLQMQRPYIQNKTPMLGPLGINFDGWNSSDHYYKGAWMLHTLRQVIQDDPLWFGALRELHGRFRHRIINSQDIIDFFNEYTQGDHTAFFEQYLTYPQLPVLELQDQPKGVAYRWRAGAKDFNMPIPILFSGQPIRIQPTTYQWQYLDKKQGDAKAVKADQSQMLYEVEIRR